MHVAPSPLQKTEYQLSLATDNSFEKQKMEIVIKKASHTDCMKKWLCNMGWLCKET